MPNQPGQARTVVIDTDYIELDKLLKREDLAASGGEARYLISEGLAQVNGRVETRKRRKLYSGDRVLFRETELIVGGKDVPVPPRACEAEQEEEKVNWSV